MKNSYRKIQPKIIHYRNFWESLQEIFPQNSVNCCDKYVDKFLLSSSKNLDRYAPHKKKYVKGNHSSFMNKNLSNAMMLRTKLRKFFLKNRTNPLSKEIYV